MGAKSRYSLQRTMIIYFLLIGFASVLVSVEFMADFHSGSLKSEIWDNLQRFGNSDHHQKEIFAPIDRMRSKAMLMVAIILVVMLIVLTMFIKNITEPLQHMIKVSEKISAGDLSQSVRIDANNELAELGNVINEMATNLQEIILLSQRMSEGGKQYVEEAIGLLNQRPLSDDHLPRMESLVLTIKNELVALEEVISCFNFYSVDKQHHDG